jgi:hypothetical protein
LPGSIGYLTTVYIIVPSLMVVVSLLARARIDRTANIVVSLCYAVTAAATIVGESWTYYIIGTIVEVTLLLAIARVAWTWSESARPLPQGRDL